MEAYMDKTNEDYDYESLKYVGNALKYAREWGLESEVVLFALSYAANNPGATFAECMDYGMGEWIK